MKIEPKFKILIKTNNVESGLAGHHGKIFTLKTNARKTKRMLENRFPGVCVKIVEVNHALSAQELMKSKCRYCKFMKSIGSCKFSCSNQNIRKEARIKMMNSSMCLYFRHK